MPIQEFIALAHKFADLRLQFMMLPSNEVVAQDTEIQEQLFKLVDVRWRDYESAVLKKVIDVMNNLNKPFERIDELRYHVHGLQDSASHLNMALLNHSVWDSYATYFHILSETRTVFDFFELEELGCNPTSKGALGFVSRIEEDITKRFTKIMKRAVVYCDDSVHLKPRFTINQRQSKIESDCVLQRKTLKKFASTLVSSPEQHLSPPTLYSASSLKNKRKSSVKQINFAVL